jgi:hypothetical protein
VKVVLLKNIEAATCRDTFLAGWTATLTTDRSTSSHPHDLLSIQHALATSFHPRSNGMVERVHSQIKDDLRAGEVNPT